MDWPEALEAAQEIEIETRRDADSPVHRTTVWPVVEEGQVFVRSLRGDAGRWYREMSANPEAVVHLDDESIDVLAVPAPDAQSAERASRRPAQQVHRLAVPQLDAARRDPPRDRQARAALSTRSASRG